MEQEHNHQEHKQQKYLESDFWKPRCRSIIHFVSLASRSFQKNLMSPDYHGGKLW
jgi:hypothetical protein